MRAPLLIVMLFACSSCSTQSQANEDGDKLAATSSWQLARSTRAEPQIEPWAPRKVQFHPKDPHRLLVVEGDGTVSIWDVEDRKEPSKLLTLITNANAACFSTDGGSILSGGRDGKLTLWSGRRGTQIWQSKAGHRDSVRSVAFSPTSDLLASAADDGTVRLWDLDGSPRGQPLTEHQDWVNSVAFSPSGDLFASAADDGMVRVWNLDGSPRGQPLDGHHGGVWSVAFSPRGILLASAGDDKTVRLWNLDGSPRGEPLTGHRNRVLSVAFSPSGNLLASAAEDGTVRLWNLDGSPRGQPLTGHQGGVGSVAFSPTGDLLASAADDGTVRLWNLDGSPRGYPLTGHLGKVSSVAFSPVDALLASAGDDGTVRLWNLDGSPRGQPLIGHQGVVWSVAFSPSGDLLASGGADGTVRLWNLDGSPRGRPLIGHQGVVWSVAFSPIDDLIASAGADRTVRLWNLSGSPRGGPLPAQDVVRSMAFSPAGDVLALAGSDGTVRLWNLDGTPRGEPLIGHQGWVWSVAFSPGGDRLASAGVDGIVRLWSLDNSSQSKLLTGHQGIVRSLAFSPVGDLLVLAGSDGTVRLWNLDGSPRGEPLTGHQGWVWAVAFSPTGDLLTSAGDDGTVRLWNLDGSPRGQPLSGYQGWVLAVALSPVNDLLASAESDGTVRLWNLDGSPHGQPLIGHQDWVRSVVFSPTGDLLASAGNDGTVRLWNLDGSPRGHPLTGHEDWVDAVAFSPAGDLLASAGADGTVRLWNLDGSPQGEPLTGHRDWVWAVAFSPAGDLLASAGADGTVRLWNLDGSPQGEPLTGHQDWVESVSFSATGDLLASAGADGKVRLWNLDGSPRSEPLTGHQGRVKSIAFSPTDDLLASAGADGTVRLWNLDGRPLATTQSVAYQVGFFRNTVWALGYGFLAFYSRELQARARMRIAPQGSILFTTQGYYSGQGRVVRAVLHFSEEGELLPAAEVASRRLYSPGRVEAAVSGEHPWWIFIWTSFTRSWESATNWYLGLSTWLKVPVVYLAGVLFIVVFWVVRPATLATWAMPSDTWEDPPLGWLLVVGMTWVRWLGGAQRSLDSWLQAHGEDLDRCFVGKKAVEDRSNYLDLGNEEEIAAWKTATHANQPATRWITGPGGCGKSTLAFEMARSARTGRKHPVLLILVEEDWGGSILAHVTSLLVIKDRRPTDRMVKKLSRNGRLLVVVDGLSERRINKGQRQEIAELVVDGTFRHLLVTSRDVAASAAMAVDASKEIRVGPLEPRRLADFVHSYVGAADAQSVVGELHRLSRGKPVRPLFARLAIDQLEEGNKLPNSNSALIHRYVQALRPQGESRLSEVDFLRAARIAAKACVKEELAPRAVTAEFLRGHLAENVAFSGEDGKEVPALAVLQQLVRCGLLTSIVESLMERIRFAHDPVAEYLMAAHILEQPQEVITEYDERIKKRGDAAQGLAEALQDLLQEQRSK